MQILHVISEMQTGGAQSLLSELLRDQHKDHHQTYTASSGGPLVQDLTRELPGFRNYFVPTVGRDPLIFLRAVSSLSVVLREINPSIAFAHNPGSLMVLLAAQLRSRVRFPIVTVLHGSSNTVLSFYWAILHKFTTSCVVVDKRLIRGNRTDRVRCIPCGVRVDDLAPEKKRSKSGVLRAVIVSRLAYPKRVDLLIRAFEEAETDFRLTILGDGPLRVPLENCVPSSLRTSIQFAGNVNNVRKYLNESDVMFFASEREGAPVAVLEAMSAGVPVVANEVGALPEILDGCGILVPQLDAKSFASEIKRIASNPEILPQMSQSSWRRVHDKYSIEKMLQSYNSVLCCATGCERNDA